MILVSYILPIYNIELALIIRCIDSILEQGLTPTQYEIILVDDGSTTPYHLDQFVYAGIDIRLIRQENKGLGGARNTGIEQSQGKYLLFVDTDDYLFPNQVQKLVDRIEQHDLHTVAFKYKGVHGMERTSMPQRKEKNLFEGSGVDYILDRHYLGACWLYLYRKDLLEKPYPIRFEDRMYHEDEVFSYLWLMRCKKAHFTNQRVYAYYHRSDSITQSRTIESLQKRRKDLLHAILLIKANLKNGLTELERKATHRRVDQLTMDNLIVQMRNFPFQEVYREDIATLKKNNLIPLHNPNISLRLRTYNFLSKSYWGLRLIKFIDQKR